jgi:hypothetical protein
MYAPTGDHAELQFAVNGQPMGEGGQRVGSDGVGLGQKAHGS